MQKKILVIGSMNMDYMIETKKLPRPGETVISRSIKNNPGGKGANQAYAAAQLGGNVAMLGAVGDDNDGRELIANLAEAGADVSRICKVPGLPTGKAFVAIEDTGENFIFVVPGANHALTVDVVRDNMDLIDSSDYIIVQLEIPLDTVRYIRKAALEKGKVLILDPAPAVGEIEDDFWKGINVIKPNETELSILTGRKLENREDYLAAAREMTAKGVGTVVLTLGSQGCMVVTEKRDSFYPAVKVRTIDTTAAGDSFTAALTVALSEGKDMEEAVRFARTVSAVVVTRKGAQNSIPARDEITSD